MPEGLLNGELANILNFIAAAGGLGTASFGLVDATKAIRGGVSNAGFGFIRKAVLPLIGSHGQSGPKIFGKANVLATLKANWMNGVAKADQKAVAKSLIRLGLTPDNAEKLADATGVLPEELKACAENVRRGADLSPENINVLGRFDAIVSAVLDEGYERADQKYRNMSKLVAGVVSIALAMIAGGLIFNVANPNQNVFWTYFQSRDFAIAILIGLISTPLAPVAKDLSSSLTAAVKAVGLAKR